jgi:hypothetical protein
VEEDEDREGASAISIRSSINLQVANKQQKQEKTGKNRKKACKNNSIQSAYQKTKGLSKASISATTVSFGMFFLLDLSLDSGKVVDHDDLSYQNKRLKDKIK